VQREGICITRKTICPPNRDISELCDRPLYRFVTVAAMFPCVPCSMMWANVTQPAWLCMFVTSADSQVMAAKSASVHNRHRSSKTKNVSIRLRASKANTRLSVLPGRVALLCHWHLVQVESWRMYRWQNNLNRWNVSCGARPKTCRSSWKTCFKQHRPSNLQMMHLRCLQF